jgi:hypothetical protein
VSDFDGARFAQQPALLSSLSLLAAVPEPQRENPQSRETKLNDGGSRRQVRRSRQHSRALPGRALAAARSGQILRPSEDLSQ